MTKPPEPELSPFQSGHKFLRGAVKGAADWATKAARQTSNVLRDVDNKFRITERAQEVGKGMGGRLHVPDMAKDALNTASGTVRGAVSKVRRQAEKHGVTSFMTDNVIDPITGAAETIVTSKPLRAARDAGEEAYGATRGVVVSLLAPDLPTYDSYELLQGTKRELHNVVACILQVSSQESSQLGAQFSRAVTAKLAGGAGTAALLTLVATFGHAGTGTAIAGLSGAAATSATMAWVGGLVGGGVAAGTALTGGLTLVIGLAAYKALASERRAFESLSELEQRIVQSCWMLAAVADAYQKHPENFTPENAHDFLEKMLTPLHQDISANIDVLRKPLDSKNAIALRQHVLRDFQTGVIDRFNRYLSWAYSDAGRAWHASLVSAGRVNHKTEVSASDDPVDFVAVLRAGQVETAIGGVFAALLTREPLDDSTESRLVLDALRRSSLELRDASQEELGDYLHSKSPEELRGIASNVKGIYHEFWYVEQYNVKNEGTYARVFEQTNYAGADVQIVDADTGEVRREIQLKAVESSSAVDRHLERYPDIYVVATNEVAAKNDDPRVDSSGVDNAQLGEDVASRFDALQDHTLSTRAADTALLAVGISSTAELVEMLRGKRSFPAAIMSTAAKGGVAAGATALTAVLFG